MQYGKIIKSKLVYAPKVVVIDDMNIWNASEEQMLFLGWKPIVFNDMPEDAPTGYYYKTEWEETEAEIIQNQVLTELPEDIDEYEAYQIIIGGLE